MGVVVAITGQIGAGKTWTAGKELHRFKSDGMSTLLTSFADPIKMMIRDHFGMLKSGWVDATFRDVAANFNPVNEDDAQTLHDFKIHLLGHTSSPIFAPTGYDEVSKQYNDLMRKYGDTLLAAIRGAALGDYKANYRIMAQLVGTEFGRGLDNDIWVNATLSNIKRAFDDGFARAAIIDDLRFGNEYEKLKSFRRTGHEVRFIGVRAPVEVRSQRTGVDPEVLALQAQHGSEREIPDIIERILEDGGTVINNH